MAKTTIIHTPRIVLELDQKEADYICGLTQNANHEETIEEQKRRYDIFETLAQYSDTYHV